MSLLSIYDWTSINLAAPNFIGDSVDTSSVQLEQFLLRKGGHQIALQGAWHREDAERHNFNFIGQTTPAVGNRNYLTVDVNERLLDGRPNPYFLRPYIGLIEGSSIAAPNVRDTFRGQAAYVADFTENRGWTRRIGRHQFLGYYEFRDNRALGSYRHRYANVSLPGNPVYVVPGTRGQGANNTALRTYNHYYVGDNQGQNVDYAPGNITLGDYDFQWFDPRTNRWITDRAQLGLTAWPQQSVAGARTVIKTRGVMMQNQLLKNRVILTFGERTDENWFRPHRPLVIDPDGIDFVYTDRGQVRVSPGWSLQKGDTFTKGIVIKPLRWLHAHYNESDSFRPATQAVNLALELVDRAVSFSAQTRLRCSGRPPCLPRLEGSRQGRLPLRGE